MITEIERDLDGVPIALSLISGLGLPIVSPSCAPYEVFRNGARLTHCVAFDRASGLVWMQSGRIIGDEWEVIRMTGDIAVQPIDLETINVR